MDVRTICLGILTLGDSTGYEIKKTFEEGPFSQIFDASFGSIYPAMNRLMEEGLVTCTEIPQDRRPNKKIYSVTSEGREQFAEDMTRLRLSALAPDRIRSEFLATMMFADEMKPRELRRLLDERLAHHRASLADLEQHYSESSSAGERFVVGFGATFHRNAIEFIEAERTALERDVEGAVAAE